MTPDSMVEKLDSFDNVKEGENGPNQADLDVSHVLLGWSLFCILYARGG